jgi:hypothetical protein
VNTFVVSKLFFFLVVGLASFGGAAVSSRLLRTRLNDPALTAAGFLR